MIVDYIIGQLRLYRRHPLWLLLCALLALPITMLVQLASLQDSLLNAHFISKLSQKTVSSIVLAENENAQALPLFLSQEAEQQRHLQLSYERSFSTFAKLPEKYHAVQVSAFSGGFSEFGINASLGSLARFPRQLIQNNDIAVLSFVGWHKLFAADPAVIGRWVSINDQPYQIVAVLDKTFTGFRQQLSTDIIIPFAKGHLGDGDILPDTLSYWLNPTSPSSELAELEQQLRDDFLLSSEQRIVASNAIGMTVSQFNALTQRIVLLQWLVVLLLAFCMMAYCGILLSEQQKRHNEYQLRLKLGASLRDLQIQRWVELSMNGALLMLLCALIMPIQHSLLGQLFPDVSSGHLTDNYTALTFSAGGALAIIAIGLMIYAIQDRFMSATLGRGQTQSLWQKGITILLLSMQISLAAFSSFTTLTLLIKQISLFNEDLGFKPQNLYVLTFDPLALNSTANYNSSLPALFQRIKQTATELEVTASIVTPLSTTYMFGNWKTSSGNTVGNVNGGGTYTNRVSQNYFQVMQTPLLFGRIFYPQAPNEIVVNRALWQRYFQNNTLLSANLQYNGNTFKVVGVVENIRYQGPDQQAEPVIYQPLVNLFEFTQLIIRSKQPSEFWQDILLNNIKQQHPLLSAEPLSTMSDRVKREHAQRMGLLVLMLLLSLGGIIAAVIFTYASIKQMLQSTSTELALRFSLGARLFQLMQTPLSVLLSLHILQIAFLYIAVSPKLQVGAEPSIILLAVVVATSVSFIALLMTLMFNQVIRHSWLYLTK